MKTQRLISLFTAFAVVTASGTGYAAAQTTTTPSTTATSETPTSTAPAGGSSTSTTTTASPGAGGDVSCPAVHMLLAPGTSETARFAEPNRDTHGFLSRSVARPLLGSVNEQTVRDLSGGFAQLLNLPEGMAGPLGDAAVQATERGEQQEQKLTRTYVTYPATVGGAQPAGQTEIPENAGDLTSYENSLNTGIDMTEELIADISSRCPETKVFLTGFSQGAEVIDNVARRIGAGETEVDADQIAGVSLFANPTREGGTPLQPEGATTVGPVPGTSGTNVAAALEGLDRLPTANAGGLSTDKTGIDGYGALADRVVSWCNNGDYVCGLPVESELVADIVKQLEPMSLGDPVAALKRLAQIFDRAVSVGDISEIADIKFAGTGFDVRPDGGAQTPVLTKRVEAASEDDDTESSTTDSAAPGQGAATETRVPGGVLSEQSSPAQAPETEEEAAAPSSEQPAQNAAPAPAPAPGLPALPALPEMPALPQLPPPPPLPTPEQAVGTVVGVAAGLGGMALGAGITVARKTVTPENLAQIAIAGVTGGPQAAGTVAAAKLSQSAMTLLEPGSASGYARQTLQILKDNGVPVPEQAEMAVSLAAWLSTSEHNAYADRPMLPDGRSAAAATNDWVEAIVADLDEEESSSQAPESSSETPDKASTADQGMNALEAVDFDSEKAHKALASIGTDTTSSSSPVSSSSETTSETSSTTANTTSSSAVPTSPTSTDRTSELSTTTEGN